MGRKKRTAARAPAPAAPPATPARDGRLRPLPYVVAFVAFLADQATKLLTIEHLRYRESVSVLDGWFAFTRAHNEGAAFSFLSGQVPVLTIVTAVIAIGIIVYERKIGPRVRTVDWALGLVLGGALGNLLDRIRLGYVVDMLDLQNGAGKNIWPIFNVADIVLVVGIGLFVIASFRAPREAKTPQATDAETNAKT